MITLQLTNAGQLVVANTQNIPATVTANGATCTLPQGNTKSAKVTLVDSNNQELASAAVIIAPKLCLSCDETFTCTPVVSRSYVSAVMKPSPAHQW